MILTIDEHPGLRTWKQTARRILRWGLGVLLLTAAGLEAYQLATEPILGKGLLSARWFRIGWVEFEIFLGVWLLCGVYRRSAWLTTLGCFMIFSGVTLTKGLQGQASCGCFGKVEVNPWYTFALDTVAVLGLLLIRPDIGSPQRIRRPAIGAAVGLVCVLVLGIPAGVAMSSYQPTIITAQGELVGESRIVLLEPETWPGQRFPLLAHIDIGEKLSRGRWVVMLFNRGCSGCAEALPRYRQMAKDWGDRSGVAVALVELPRHGESGKAQPGQDTGPVWGRLDDRQDWFVTTPTVVLLVDGVVKAAWEGTAPKPEELLRRLR
ncbi:MAG: MauE/DoxX family redox-associated membrane protein [Planctomycetota bacterium]